MTQGLAAGQAPRGLFDRLLGRFKIDRYLLLIISMVVAASLAPARGEAAVGFAWATKIAIGLVFFLHGARLSREAVIGGLIHWRLHLVVLASTFVVFPILCLALTALPGWITPPALSGGLEAHAGASPMHARTPRIDVPCLKRINSSSETDQG